MSKLAGVIPRQEADVHGFHNQEADVYGCFYNFETATKLAEQKTNETGKQHCVLHAEDIDGPRGMFTLGVYPPRAEIITRELINKIMRTLGR